jgi:hypothetical protein
MQVQLNGIVRSEGTANEITLQWSKVSGPGEALFTDANSATTRVTFTAAGDYVLRLTANHGTSSQSDDVAVTVAETLENRLYLPFIQRD